MVPVGKVNSSFHDWFVEILECGHFALKSIHEVHETCSIPLPWCVKISSAALGWAMSFVSNESRSLLSCLKWLPISVKTWNNLSTLSRKTCCTFGVCSWWFVCTRVSLASEAISYWATSWLTSGPAIIHLLSAEGSSVTPMAPPLACSCAWSMICVQQMHLSGTHGQAGGVSSSVSTCLSRGWEALVRSSHCCWRRSMGLIQPVTDGVGRS